MPCPITPSRQTGGNQESGRIQQVIQQARRCAVSETLAANARKNGNSYCPAIRAGGQPISEGNLLAARMAACTVPLTTPPPSASAMLQSAYIATIQQKLLLANTNPLDPTTRFNAYVRWSPPGACIPLPVTANGAGQPSALSQACLPGRALQMLGGLSG